MMAHKRMDSTDYYNGMTFTTSEVKIKPKHSTNAGEWSVSFSKEPAKVGSKLTEHQNLILILFCRSLVPRLAFKMSTKLKS